MQAEDEQKEKSDKSEANESSSDERENNSQGSVWEWITAFVGFVLVVGTIGFLLYEEIRGEESPPDIKVQVESIEQINNGYLVKFSALNQGETTAEGVVVEANLKRGAEKTETSQTTIDYLPAHSTRKGGFFFQNDPRQFNLEARALGYQQP